jgi:hypothetical protein
LLPEAGDKPIDNERFKTRSQCFINQYGNVLFPEAGDKPVGIERLKTRSQCFINQYENFLLPEADDHPEGTEQLKQDHNVSLISTETCCCLRRTIIGRYRTT